MKTQQELYASLKPKTDKHQQLSQALLSRLKMSRDKMSERYKQFAENEEQYASYVPAATVEKARKDSRDLPGNQDFVTLSVPYSYAAIMTIHTYISSVFLSRTPVYQVQARHGETEQQTQALEALLDYQLVAGRHQLPHFIGLFDPLKYGFSVVGQYWDEEEIQVRRFVDEVPTMNGVPIPEARPQKVPRVERIKGYAGSKLFNVRPQDFFPDVRVPLYRFQEGEFCGRYVEMPWYELKQGEVQGKYFNVDQARDHSKTSAGMTRDRGSHAVSTVPEETIESYLNEKPSSLFKGYEIQWKLSPKQWRLGDEGGIEMWVFLISEGGVIVQARPLGMYYSGFGYDLFLYEPDGYNLFPTAALERIRPLNDTLSWLLNTHFYNVRAALNNQFIFDPTMVVEKDLTSRKPGQLIRLKPAAYGRDVRMAIQQLPVADMTRSHLQDAQVVELMIQRALGATDNVMGMVNTSGRKTATEVRTSTSFGVNRIKTLCEMASVSGFGPLVQKIIQSSQQLYEGGRKHRLVGDLASFSPTFLEVEPEAIAGFYDYVPVDGTLPVDRYAQAQLWNQLIQQAAAIPPVAQQYDLVKIYGWVAALAGLKNIHQFRIQPMDPAQLQQQAQLGNVVPVDTAMRDLGRVPDPGRAQGMGATG